MITQTTTNWWPLTRVLLFLSLALPMIGCTPRVIVRPHPQPGDRGLRFYRPKPYLKVEPAEVAIDKNQTRIVPGLVRISLVYMPDFSEEYAIDVRSGLGVANVGIKLDDGWNLTEISQELDSQTDENTKAFASLLSAVGDVTPTASSGARSATPTFTVPARNVPIGFYESIIGRDGRGCKRLYGFRYVGFVPFSGCPLNMGGSESVCCDDPNTAMYGLSFVDGQMLFLPLTEMAHVPATSAAAFNSTATHAQNAVQASEAAAGLPATPLALPLTVDQLSRLELQLRAHLNSIFDSIGEVRAETQADRLQVRIRIPASLSPLPIQRTAQAWLRDKLGESQAFDVELSQ